MRSLLCYTTVFDLYTCLVAREIVHWVVRMIYLGNGWSKPFCFSEVVSVQGSICTEVDTTPLSSTDCVYNVYQNPFFFKARYRPSHVENLIKCEHHRFCRVACRTALKADYCARHMQDFTCFIPICKTLMRCRYHCSSGCAQNGPKKPFLNRSTKLLVLITVLKTIL